MNSVMVVQVKCLIYEQIM